jgi:hypothetical protein
MAESKFESKESSDSDKVDFVLRFAEHVDGKEFNQRCAAYFKKYISIVDPTLDKDECSHEYWEAYQGYQVLVDEMLQDFLQSEGIKRPSELYEKLKDCYDSNPYASEYIEFLISVMTFESFADCLRSYWRQFSVNRGLSEQVREDINESKQSPRGRPAKK